MNRLLMVLAVLILSVGLMAPAFSEDGGKKSSSERSSKGEKKKRKKAHSGKITAVNVEKGTVTIEKGSKDKKKSKTFSLPKNVKIKVNKKEGTLADVKIGMTGSVKFESDNTTISGFSAHDYKPKAHKKKKENKEEKEDEAEE